MNRLYRAIKRYLVIGAPASELAASACAGCTGCHTAQNDGLGSGNYDCTASNQSGCWGHRHDILWSFRQDAVLAMGAAAGLGPKGGHAYAMLLAGGYAGYRPTYVYTWSQAVADGAGTNAYDAGVPQTTFCVAPSVIGKTLTIAERLITRAHCSLGTVTSKIAPSASGTVIRQSLAAGTRRAA